MDLIWNFPDFAIVLTPLYGLYFSFVSCSVATASPIVDVKHFRKLEERQRVRDKEK